MSRPTVWVVKEQVRRDSAGPVPMDYTPATKFGDLKFITDFDLPLNTQGSLATEWGRKLAVFMKEYDPDADWIVLTGSPLSIFMVGVSIGWAKLSPRILVWRREQGEYVPFDSEGVVV